MAMQQCCPRGLPSVAFVLLQFVAVLPLPAVALSTKSLFSADPTNLTAASSTADSLVAGKIFNPYSTVIHIPVGSTGVTSEELAKGKKYLVGTFPNMKQVAYCQLPDNVWRPLVTGSLTKPTGVAVDMPNKRLYVSDPPEGKIYWYTLGIRPNGQLKLEGVANIAVEGFSAGWMTVNGIGDLYFTGKMVVTPPASSYDGVYRQDAQKIAFGNTRSPVEVYGRSNSGNPFPKVWMPSGIAVDSFFIYWGNQDKGLQHGAVVKGNRQSIGLSELSMKSLNQAQDEVRGMCATGMAIYYLTPSGVYGVNKGQGTTLTDVNGGLVAGPPADDLNGVKFDPKSIAWDGDGSAYISDFTAGMVYTVPVMDLNQHNLTKFVDAPGIHGMAVVNFELSHANRGSASILFVLLAFMTYWA